ncbi:hypothetical protein [Microbacterium sp. NPDC096154]|uniref:hypothetical protein n=1 Tax=Microbacterium sp. NPDC096154 TaxID=3155549 RepID=UPI0033243EB4
MIVAPASPLGGAHTRRSRLAAAAVVLLLASALALMSLLFAPNVPSASADDVSFGSTCSQHTSGYNAAPCFADDANMDFCTAVPWDSTYGNVFMARMAYLDSATDMYDTYTATCGAQTDIGGWLNSSKEIDLRGSTVLGAALCTKPLGGWGNGKCDQGSLVVHSALTGSGAQFAKTMCHEIGHFTGLWHYSSSNPGSCMVSGASSLTTYSTAERALINGRY